MSSKAIQTKWPNCECLPHAANVNNWEECNKLYEATMGALKLLCQQQHMVRTPPQQ